jgi:hypothetical protein
MQRDVFDMRLGDFIAKALFLGSQIAVIWAFGHFVLKMW